MSRRLLGATFLFVILFGMGLVFSGCLPQCPTCQPATPVPAATATNTRTATNTPTAGSPTATSTVGIPTSTPTYCATNSLTWTAVATIPSARDRFGTAVVGNVIYAIGGGNGNSTKVESYNPSNNTWTTGLASMPTGRNNLGVVQVNGIIYAIGGNGGGGVVGTVESYNPGTNSWATGLAAMPNPRSNFGIAVVNGIIYTIGGDNPSANPVTNVDSYNPATDTWTTGLAAFPTPLSQFQTAVLNGIIYVAGGQPNSGFNATLGIVNTLMSYNPSSNSWTTGLATVPDSLTCALACTMNGLFYVVGGIDNGAYPGIQSSAYAYNPTTNSWSTKSSMANVQSGQGGGVVNGVIYSISGWNGGAFVNINQAGALACQ